MRHRGMLRRCLISSAVFTVSLFFLLSCNENTLFMPEMDLEPEVSLETIRDGEIISQEEGIPFSLLYTSGSKGEEVTVSSLEIFIEDAENNRVREIVLSEEDLAVESDLLLDIQDLPEGVYSVNFMIYEKEELLSEKRVYFFNTQSPPSLLSVSAYPPVFYPGSEGILQANLETEEEDDPYLRWKLGDSVQGEGYLSQGLDKLAIPAPVTEGIYSVQVEVFPEGPPEDISYPFISEINQTLEIFVSKDVEPGPNELTPNFSYYSVLHFQGNLRDQGIRTDLAEGVSEEDGAVPVGEPHVDIWERMFGYYLNGNSGFSLDGIVLPFYRNGNLSPFSLNFRLMVEELKENSTLLDTYLTDDTFKFRVFSTEEGKLNAHIRADGKETVITSEYPLLNPKTAVSLSISVLPQEDSTIVMWFLNGILVSLSEISFPIRLTAPIGIGEEVEAGKEKDEYDMIRGSLAAEGETIIGGENGITGIIDEFGVYFRDEQSRPSPDDEVYSKAMESEYGSSLRYAEGFEGIFLPGELKVEGDVMVNTSNLVLEPDSSVVFPDFLFDEKSLFVEAGIDSEPDTENPGKLEIKAVYNDTNARTDNIEDNLPLFVFYSNDTIAVPDGDVYRVMRKDNEPLTIEFNYNEDTLFLIAGDQHLSVPVKDEFFQGISLKVVSPDRRIIPLKVSHVLARLEREKISARLNTSYAEEEANKNTIKK